jgi:hypothetical protein
VSTFKGFNLHVLLVTESVVHSSADDALIKGRELDIEFERMLLQRSEQRSAFSVPYGPVSINEVEEVDFSDSCLTTAVRDLITKKDWQGNIHPSFLLYDRKR